MHGMQKCAKLLIINRINAVDWLNTIKMRKIGLNMNFWPIFLANLGPRVLHIFYSEFRYHGKWGTDTKWEARDKWLALFQNGQIDIH